MTPQKEDTCSRSALERALNNVQSVLGIPSLRACFVRFSKLDKSASKLKTLAGTRRKDQILSYLAELRYTLVFLGLGFHIEIEPLGRKRAGPDLKISRDGACGFVEVRYFADVHSNPPKKVSLEELRQHDFRLEPYGNPARDQQRVHDRILEKLEQLVEDTSILVLWNDKEDMEEGETECAVRQIQEEASSGLVSIPDSLLFIVYGSDWWGRQQFYCYPLRETKEPHSQWMHELETSSAMASINRALDDL